MAKRKGQQRLLMSERLSCSCHGFCGASEQEDGAHITCRLADGNLEQIVDYSQIYSASRGGAWRWPVDL